jgi:hypothetical protein
VSKRQRSADDAIEIVDACLGRVGLPQVPGVDAGAARIDVRDIGDHPFRWKGSLVHLVGRHLS